MQPYTCNQQTQSTIQASSHTAASTPAGMRSSPSLAATWHTRVKRSARVLMKQPSQTHVPASTRLFDEALRPAIEFPEHEFGAHVAQHLHAVAWAMERECEHRPSDVRLRLTLTLRMMKSLVSVLLSRSTKSSHGVFEHTCANSSGRNSASAKCPIQLLTNLTPPLRTCSGTCCQSARTDTLPEQMKGERGCSCSSLSTLCLYASRLSNNHATPDAQKQTCMRPITEQARRPYEARTRTCGQTGAPRPGSSRYS